ncbi:MAG: acetyl-CoA carboxylase biotin carboxylase subunit, partial [Pseudomonadales bacterium]|nr:acetyl-CoA carboxylase biotin carboxylase subunit [Pseudomonadales bacterium]
MIRRVMIANRGEIALRVLRACRERGLETVGIYSRVDRNLRHLDYADSTFCISETDYVNMDSLLMAARLSGCDAVHPGYGFLSENADFARRVEEEGLTWIGPAADTIAAMGDKSRARKLVAEHGLDPVPGSEG